MQVESFYVLNGYIFPTFHKMYWIGLQSNASYWPQFQWQDKAMPPINSTMRRCAAGHRPWQRPDKGQHAQHPALLLSAQPCCSAAA
jgi:hypothetical protein